MKPPKGYHFLRINTLIRTGDLVSMNGPWRVTLLRTADRERVWSFYVGYLGYYARKNT